MIRRSLHNPRKKEECGKQRQREKDKNLKNPKKKRKKPK
jgi:hypothetical protein